MAILMVAEKPLLAESISKFLATGPINTRRGISGFVHEFMCNFRGRPQKAKMTAVAGHVYTCEFEADFQKWSVDPEALFSCKVKKEEANPKTHIPAHLKNEAKGCSAIVLWLDCDREGENICFEVLDNTVDYMQKGCRIYRAIFSSITKNEIVKAFNNLGSPDPRLAEAVDARQEIDLRVGAAFTRLQTTFLKEKFPRMGDALVSFGPCQTPTLGFCVQRYKDILNFVPKAYYIVKVNVNDLSGRSKKLKLENRFDDKAKADAVLEECRSCSGIVKKMNVTESRKSRPTGLNTVEMLKGASLRLGMSPSDTMHIAEKLYTQGYISYPRTESTKFSQHFGFDSILAELGSSTQFAEKVQLVRANGINVPKGGEDKGDHPPITPLTYPQFALGDGEMRLYQYICNSFLASLYKDAVFQKASVSIEFGKYSFSGSGKILKDPGFLKMTTKLDDDDDEEDDAIMPDSFKLNEKIEGGKFEINKGMTTCPDYLTEYELITLMEKNGIGTDASIPVHIGNIINRGYVTLNGAKRTLQPTKHGLALTKTYDAIEKKLVSPEIRAHIESNVCRIAEGKADMDSVISEALEVFENTFLKLRKNLKVLEDNFGELYQVQDQSRSFSNCGKCGRMLMKVISTDTYLMCNTCAKKYELPQKCTYTQNSVSCPICNFETVMTTTKDFSKKELICPNCYNSKNDYMAEDHSGCLNCMNPKCKFSREYTKVCLCSVCGGEMCLSLLQNKYSCFCCTCESHIEWSADVKKATIGVPCEKCKQYHTIDITLKNGQTVTGCLQCDLPIKKLSDIKAVFPGEEKRGGRRGRGVYRGRGGFSSRGRGGSHASSRGGSSSRGRGGNTRGRGGRGN